MASATKKFLQQHMMQLKTINKKCNFLSRIQGGLNRSVCQHLMSTAPPTRFGK